MILPVVRDPAALRDLLQAFVFLGRRSPQSARRFLQAAERTFALLAGHPGIGVRYEPTDPAYAEIRICPIGRFRSYLVVYRATDDRLEVLRVLHAARDVDGILAETFNPPADPG